MRILTVVEQLGPGGTERAAQNCSLWYAGAGHEVAVLGYGGGGPRARLLETRGVTVFAGGQGAQEDASVRDAIAWRPDVVHIHRPGATDPRSGAILRRLKGPGAAASVIETSHFARVDASPDGALIDVHLQISLWCLWKWRAWSAGLRPAPLGVLLPHLVDTRDFFPADAAAVGAWRDAHGIPSDAFVFGRLGQPNPPSWMPAAIDAFEEVAVRRPEAYLVLVGLPARLEHRVERLREDVRRRVINLPFVFGDDKLRVCYSGLDCFLHASMCGESFGYVLVESMLCQTPVITLSTPTRGNSQVEVVGHERGGLVANDRRSLITAMERLMDDPAERRRFGEQGRRHVLDSFAMDALGPRLGRVVELAAARAGAPADSAARGELRKALEAEGFVPHVEPEVIRRLMRRSLGHVSMRSRVILRASHVRFVYAGIVWLKSLKRRFNAWRGERPWSYESAEA